MVYFRGTLHGQIQFFLVEELIRWKTTFKTFLIDHNAGDIENKKSAGTY